MTVGSALDHILSQTSGSELTWIAKDELLLITTKAAAESEENMFLRGYNISRIREISHLTATVRDFNPAQGGGIGGGGAFFNLSDEASQSGGSIESDVPPDVPRKKKTEPSRPLPEESEVEVKNPDAVITWEAGLLQTIQDLTSPPCAWQETNGEGGKMSIAGNRLIVRQSLRGHEQVVAVLEQLDMAAESINLPR